MTSYRSKMTSFSVIACYTVVLLLLSRLDQVDSSSTTPTPCVGNTGQVPSQPPGTCQTCADGLLCQFCADNYLECSQCYDGAGKTSFAGTTCQKCFDGCSLCEPTVYNCRECANVTTQGPNKAQAQLGYCADCSAHCQDCSTAGSGACDVCVAGWTVNQISQQCEQCAPDCPVCSAVGSCNTCLANTGLTSPTGTPPADCAPCAAANCINCLANDYNCTQCGYGTGGQGTPGIPTAAGQCYGPPNDAPWIIPRPQWGALPPKTPLALASAPFKWVIIHHTFTNSCFSLQQCVNQVKKIQKEQMFIRYHVDMPDIAYNFLIGQDGRVYEGVGWNYVEKVEQESWDRPSLHVAFIGNFSMSVPNHAALNILQKLLLTGQPHNLAPTYLWFGHRDVSCTLCPAGSLYYFLRHQARASFRVRWGGKQISCQPHTRGWMHPM